MADIRNKYVSPSIGETAFNCPHCGSLAKQFWYMSIAENYSKDATPTFYPKDYDLSAFDSLKDVKKIEIFKDRAKKMISGRPFFDETNTSYSNIKVQNLSISKCFNCNDVSIWIYDKLVWPASGEAPLANTDLPKNVRADYDEASTILDLSPRGATALLRLCIQKLCKFLGEPGKNINDDIASLVKKGLPVQVQQALDVVRVVGNNAVHPGQIDLKDDRPAAEKLFGLVNLISEIMISQPKHVNAMFDELPPEAKAAIEKRDKKK